MNILMPVERIEHLIYFIRGRRVMLSTDLAVLYAVEPRALVQAVKRNTDRFPSDFMFQLDKEELDFLKSQNVISNPPGRGGIRRAAPYAFTEQGVAMLSSILNSAQAVKVNIEIMRAFVRLREMLSSHKELAIKIDLLENKYDEQFAVVFEAIRKLMESPDDGRVKKIGFRTEEIQ